ncbi:MAG: hypothetical protein WAX69_11610 [Victivallales bacterium]
MKAANQMGTSGRVGVSTGNASIDRAFSISVDLVEELRNKYHGLGRVRGWLPVSGGVRGSGITEPEATRDSAHAVQMASYLWGDERGIADTMESAMFLEFVDPVTGMVSHPCYSMENGPIANEAGMHMRCAADTYRYFGPAGNLNEALRRALLTAQWVVSTFDPEGSGLLDCRGESFKSFHGAHLGEASHFPSNLDPKSKTVIETMAFCVWLQRMTEAARQYKRPESEALERMLQKYSSTIEGKAWSERGGYYHCQFDRISDKWFFSMNGLCEKSRETDVVPYYCALSPVSVEHKRCVARYLDAALTRDRIFPMPIYYPTYSWYSPEHPNYADHGSDKFVLGGAWDTPYFHCVQLLSQMGLSDAVELAVRKRAEAIVRDGDCAEWYHLDGTVDHRTGYHRDRYVACATAQIAATVEGLFGITPAAPGFTAINFAPALPLFRRHRHSAPLSEMDQRPRTIKITLPGARHLEFSIAYSEADEKIRVQTNKLDSQGLFRIPIDYAGRVMNAKWGNAPVEFEITRSMGQSFVTLEHALDGGELLLGLAPHPQKGKGTTPLIEVSQSGDIVVKGCGSSTPSPAVCE